MNTQVSPQQVSVDTLFMEPRLSDFDALAASDEAFPELPSLSINDLPPMDVMSESFRTACATTKVVNEFMDIYNVSFQDRMNLIKGILSMTHGAVANTVNEQAKKEREKYLSEGGKEYYGMYL